MNRIYHIFAVLSLAVACDRISYDDYIVSVEQRYNAFPANDFLESIGVNSSIDDRGENLESTIDCMQYLGARWIRSGYTDNLSRFDRLIEEAGVSFSIMVSTDAGHTDEEKLSVPIETAVYLKQKDALVAMEGCNEPNNWSIYYNGVAGGGSNSWVPVAELHRDFYAAVKATPELADVDVWSISEAGAEVDNVGLQFLTIPDGAGTTMPAGTTYADVANIHNYFSHPSFSAPQDNQTWVASDPSSSCRVDGLYNNHGMTWANNYQGYTDEECRNLRRVTTETGITIGGPVDEEMQGRMYMSCYLAQFARGWEYTAIYILRDRSDESGNQTFGFYAPDYTPRKAAHYLHNLTTILADDRTIENPGSLSFSIPDKPETVHTLLLQKYDGTYFLVVWGENYSSGRADNIEVRLHDTFNTVNIYDPTVGTDPVQTLSGAGTVPLQMTTKPYILELK